MANQLNYKHLRYFWTVAKLGSIARASEQLHLTPQSISSQLGELEASLGAQLFQRVGRGLVLTETGHQIFATAENIFSLGDELLEIVQAQTGRRSVPFRVGIADSVPKLLAYRVVEPALRLKQPVRLICREGQLPALLAEMALQRLDLVIADRPMPTKLNVRGFNHLLGESDLTVFGTPVLIKSLKGKFPDCLNGAPFLLPGQDVAIRAGLMHWFESHGVHPHVVGEFDDSALLKSFGQAGSGLFAAPSAIADSVLKQYGVKQLGQIESVKEQLYAITTERRLKHPAIIAVINTTQQEVFATLGAA
jgi:LysR family transcriptional regulator, transcriptional activator of nhaA